VTGVEVWGRQGFQCAWRWAMVVFEWKNKCFSEFFDGQSVRMTVANSFEDGLVNGFRSLFCRVSYVKASSQRSGNAEVSDLAFMLSVILHHHSIHYQKRPSHQRQEMEEAR